MKIDTMQANLNEIKTELIGKKAVYEQQLTNAKRTLEELECSIESLKEEDVNFLNEHGFNVGWIKEIDISRLSSDEKYLDTVTNNVENLCQNLYDTLLEEVK